MSTLMATATPPPSPANFKDEPHIYISRATLQLKQNLEKFAWHTMVVATPPETTETEVQTKEVVEQCQAVASKQQELQEEQQQPQPTKPQKKHAPPPPQRGASSKKPQTISTMVDNFMDAERYHTICNSMPSEPAATITHL